jgi:hemerythrin superfamily protein
MKATELLKQQHREVEKLFKAIEDAEDDEKTELFEELASKLVAHDAIEREIFYPACEEAMGLDDLLGEALVEHGVVEFGLYQADQAAGNDDFEYKCTVLQEIVEHHVKDEEKEFFPKVEKTLGGTRLEELATQMEERFEQALEEDFRTPLYNNLKQVLGGALKPAPAGKGGSRSSKRKTAQRKSA